MATVVIRSDQQQLDNDDKDIQRHAITSRETTTSGSSRNASGDENPSTSTTTSASMEVEKANKEEDDGRNKDDGEKGRVTSEKEKLNPDYASSIVVYDVEHLATFSTARNNVLRLPQTKSNKSSSIESNNKIQPSGKQRSNRVLVEQQQQQQQLVQSNTSRVHSNYNEDDEDNDDNCDYDNLDLETFEKSCFTNFDSECREPKEALQKLFMLEKFSGIWTQRMQIKLRDEFLLIIDCETNSVVESFHRDCVTRPEAINHYNDIYNNIIVFVIQEPKQDSAKESHRNKTNQQQSVGQENNTDDRDRKLADELHIFHCVSHKAQQLVADILNWKQDYTTAQVAAATSVSKMAQATMNKSDNNGSSATKQVDDHRTPTMTSKHDSPGQKRSSTNNNNKQQASTSQASSELNSSRPMVTVASSASNNESIPIANVNVKETVQVFNQIAALREKSTSSKPTSPTGNTRPMSDSNSASSNTAVALRSPDMLSRDSALESTGQFYKQRSIRATLAPQLETSDSASSVHKNGDQKHARSSHVNYGSSISSASTSDVTKSSSSSASNNHHQSEPQHNNDPALHHSRLASSGKTFDSSTAVASHPARQQRFNSTTATEHHHQQQKSSTKSASSSRSRTKDLEVPLPDSYDQSEQVTTNESYVSVLNHCFDDIEKFIIRLQQAVAAKRELYSRRKLHKSAHRSGYSTNDALKTGSSSMISASELAILNARAAGPNEDDYFEILSKFKLAFNLLAKLKGCIHEPNAPELVHFLFTPLAIVIESARNVTPTPVDPTLVNVPYLNRDALELLSNCCTSKESDLWLSLGPNWTQTIDIKILKASRLPNSFQPIFTDGWAPVITELELIGLVAPRTMSPSYVETNGGLLQGRDSSNGLDGSVDVSSGTDYHLDRSPPYTSKSSHRTTPNGSSKVASGALGYLGKKRHSPTHLHGKLSNSYDTPLHLVDDDPRFGVIDQDGMLQSSRHHRSANRVKRGSALEMANISSSHSIQRQQPLHNRSKSHSRRTDSASRFYITDPLQSSDCDLNQAAAGYLDGSEVVPVVADRIDPRRIDLMNSYGADYGGRSRHFSPLSSSSSKQEIQRDRLDSSSRQGFHHARSSHADHHPSRSGPYASGHNLPVMTPSSFEQMTEIERETMLLDLGPAQTEWFFELQARGAMIVRVLFTREANNEKELSVQRGELLEILDDSRKWWKARNINLQVAHVPLTIVARMNTYQTLDELLTGDPADFGPGAYLDPHRRDLSEPNYHYHNNGRQDDRQARRAVGAFRYF